MGVRLAWGIIGCVLVLVMLVVHVWMGMLQWLVNMIMLVMFGEMQPYPDGHQQTGREQLGRQRLMQQHQCGDRAQERRR
jgi:hypothetical protein